MARLAERALRDEVRIVIEREEDIDRAGTYRQRRHQPADQWPGTLCSHRGREHKPAVTAILTISVSAK